jgi:hypothetical protein
VALSKYYEDIVEARRENGAAVVFEYQHPQENSKRIAHVETHLEMAPCTLTYRDRIALSVFVIKLESNPDQVGSDLLKQTYDWTPAHFNALARRSPEALARVAMALRDQSIGRTAPEPFFQPIKTRAKRVVVEVRKYRSGKLHLPSYCYCD